MSSFLAQSVMPIINWALIAPEVIVCLAAVIVMLVDAFVRPTQRWITGGISLVGIVAGMPPSGFGQLVLAARPRMRSTE
jgi:hypothetical protein